MDFALVQRHPGEPSKTLKAALACASDASTGSLALTLTSPDDPFFLYEVTLTPSNFADVCATNTFDSLHVSTLASVLCDDILPNLSSEPLAALPGTDIAVLEAAGDTATLSFMSVRSHMKVPFFSLHLTRGSDASIAVNMARIAASLEERLTTELQQFESQMARLRQENAGLSSQLAQARDDSAAAAARHENSVQACDCRLNALQLENETLRDRLRKAEDAEEAARKSCTAMQRRVGELESDLRSDEAPRLRQLLDDITAENDTLRKRLDAARDSARRPRGYDTEVSFRPDHSGPRDPPARGDDGRPRPYPEQRMPVSPRDEGDLTESSLKSVRFANNVFDAHEPRKQPSCADSADVLQRYLHRAGSVGNTSILRKYSTTWNALNSQVRQGASGNDYAAAPRRPASEAPDASYARGERTREGATLQYAQYASSTARNVLAKYGPQTAPADADHGARGRTSMLLSSNLSSATKALLEKHLARAPRP